jgi:anti-anti-sigma factor
MKSLGDVIVIDLIGRIDIETSEPFKNACKRLLGKKLILNFSQLNFVGSHGIVPFVDAVRDLVQNDGLQVKFCGMGSEFQRIFQSSPLVPLEIYEDENMAASAYKAPLVSNC